MIINAMICIAPDRDCKFRKIVGCLENLCQARRYCEFMRLGHIYIPNDKCKDCGKEEKKQ